MDKIGPGEWDDKLNYPSLEQEKSIEIKCKDIINKISKITDISGDRITYYSAIKRFRLQNLLISIIKSSKDVGWKLSVKPKDPFELSAPEVQDFINTLKKEK